ncbi:protein kinase [Streptomyces sp. NPDC048508]|uniref:AbiJ-related protein n=1 Tax=Streptomyces sp. NPDC048508 TaxID=3365561 RepID=UPI00371AD29E
MAADRPLVSRISRNAVRQLMSSLYVAAIEEYWQNEGFAPTDPIIPRQGGIRQRTFDAYEASVDWSDEGHTSRALRVFGSLIRRMDRDAKRAGTDGLEPTTLEEVSKAFELDGYVMDSGFRLARGLASFHPLTTASLIPLDARHITPVTRQRLFKFLKARSVQYYGDLDEIDFLCRLYDLKAMPSSDGRYNDAHGDIIQHRYNNADLDDDWIFSDDRFGLKDGPDAALLSFLAEMLHPAVRSNDAEVSSLAALVNELVSRDGYSFEPVGAISGYPIYGACLLTKAAPDATAGTGGAQAEVPPGRAGDPLSKDAAAPGKSAGPEPTDREEAWNIAPATHETDRGREDWKGGLPRVPVYAAVQATARGHRKDYAMDRVRMEEGGQADIFAATHKASGVRVALKRRRSQRETPAARMRREIEVAQDLNAHPHYVPILDANPAEGWLVMPMAHSTAADHRDCLRQPAALLELVHGLIDVLDVAHGHGWLHRDVKPDNILLLDDRWRLGDWGVVRRPRGQTTKADRTRTEVGTDGFAAPELFINAHHATAAADIYGVGRVIAWALTDGYPEMNVPLLPAPGPWRNIVRKATARDPLDRPQSAAELRQLIASLLSAPHATAVEEGEQLLTHAQSGSSPSIAAFLSFVADHADDADLCVGTLTRLKPELAAELLIARPTEAARSIEALSSYGAGHNRQTSDPDAYRAILWLQRVAAVAAARPSWDLLDEAARAMCVWDGARNQRGAWHQIVAWLPTLRGEAALLMAGALEEHPRAAAHYRSSLSSATLHPQIRIVISKTADR